MNISEPGTYLEDCAIAYDNDLLRKVGRQI